MSFSVRAAGFGLALATLIAGSATGAAQAQTLSIGSLPQGSLAFTVAAALARVATENSDLQVRVVPQGGPEVTIPLVETGELEFSIASSDIAAAAAAGIGSFDGRMMGNLRLVANLMPFHSGIFVAADSDIQSLEDLRGQRLAGAFPQQRVLAGYLETTLATVGLTLDDVTIVPAPNGSRGIDDLMTGAVDAAIFSPGSGAVAQADVALGGIRFLAVPDTPESDATIRSRTPGAFMAHVRPLPNRPGIEGEMAMMTGTFVLLASADVPDAEVAAVIAALNENRDALAATFPGLAAMSDDLIASPVEGLPLHAGAAGYFTAQGLTD
ncbi:TAXI family TRAP transporter solute-binding subunit [Pararhodobacter oceanensis]|uniref:TAXI family TRAP transporter solute-binding subunit n=1 Tax=Pararhodobacter oceanensis TaxID=2172121 RepID=UPI003A951CE5